MLTLVIDKNLMVQTCESIKAMIAVGIQKGIKPSMLLRSPKCLMSIGKFIVDTPCNSKSHASWNECMALKISLLYLVSSFVQTGLSLIYGLQLQRV